MPPRSQSIATEERTARLTILIDPRKKAVLEHLCEREDVTPSQVIRRLIRDYIEHKLGHPWVPGDTVDETLARARAEAPARGKARKG